MRTNSQRTKFRVDEENPYWISFSDLMSALLVVFILAVVALIIDLTQKSNQLKETIQNAENARKNIVEDIESELREKYNIFVMVSENNSVIRIPDTTLTFRPDSDRLPQNKMLRKNIEIIGRAIINAINKPFDASSNTNKKFRYEYLDTVFIEGHTDSDPSKKYKSNWVLSTYRAISLWEFWEKRVKKPLVKKTFNEMENSEGSKLFSVSGYADTRRVNEKENSKKQKQENRRIDIRFTIKRPKYKDVESILK